MERWRWVKGYEGVYQVSDQGQVKRVARSRGARPGRILRQRRDTNGYRSICLNARDHSGQYRVHRLVAEAFVPGYADGLEVNHINGDKADNRAENLEWVTHSENELHAYRHGLKRPPRWNGKGRKINLETARAIRREPGTAAEVARRYGISDTMVRNIRAGINWKEPACR